MPLQYVILSSEVISQQLGVTVVTHGVHTFHIGLKQSIFALDPILNQLLEFFQQHQQNL